MTNSFSRSALLSRDALRKAGKDADDLEIGALRMGLQVSIPISESIYDQEISEEDFEGEEIYDEEEQPEVDSVQAAIEEDTEAESLTSAAGAVILERESLLGELYPFELAGNELCYRGSRTLVYEFCLALASINVSFAKNKPLQASFERLAGVVMSLLLGPGASFLRTGYPHGGRDRSGEPLSFADAVSKLGDHMPGEWRIGVDSDMSDAKDGGVDVVVWKRVDQRAGSLIYVGNCSCGRNWLKESKHRERPSEMLQRRISRPLAHHMRDFFALPLHISERRDWDDACNEGRFVLDRIRLSLLAEKEHGDLWQSRIAEVGPMGDLIRLAGEEFKPHVRASG